MRTADEWEERWVAKLVPAQVREVLVEMKPQMVQYYTFYSGEAERIEGVVLQVLQDAEEVPATFLNIHYQAFAKRAVKCYGHYSGGGQFAAEIAIMIAAYTARGLDPAILQTIVDQLCAPVPGI